uniref:Putative DegT/DnrJ/EryC1/StrS aminotransferase family protein n=1 Tax=viral metagenome TaxID=1070528 RepID=A0A6H1ZT22_9ZZZZ
MDSILLFYPNIYKDEWIAELSEVFDTRWIGQGPKVNEFEKAFGEEFGYEYCLAVNSGSAALELAYHLVGILPGDHILSPVFTCTATNILLLRRGAKIEFLDINDQLTANYDDVVRKIKKNTRAIIVVTLGGLAVDKRIFMLADSYNIPVIVDAAQSLGVSEKYGDYICYSFQAIKHFTTGDGGILVCPDKEHYEMAKKLRWFGIDREAKKRANWQWKVNHQMSMDIEEIGYKFHMNDIQAAMGLVGLRHSSDDLAWRRRLCEAYANNLDAETVWGGSCWLLAVLTNHRDEIMEYLRSKGIECDLVQVRNDAFKVFGGQQQFPHMDRLESQYLYLPLHSRITLDDVNRVVGEFNRCKSELKLKVEAA